MSVILSVGQTGDSGSVVLYHEMERYDYDPRRAGNYCSRCSDL